MEDLLALLACLLVDGLMLGEGRRLHWVDGCPSDLKQASDEGQMGERGARISEISGGAALMAPGASNGNVKRERSFP
jgi:hypothetical protein